MSIKKKTLIYVGCAEPTHNDGCVTDHLNSQLRSCLQGEACSVESIDVIKIPGPDRLAGSFDELRQQFICDFLTELCGAHDVVAIAITGHADCAGHPVSDEQHREDTMASASFLSDHFIVPIFGFFAHKVGGGECSLDFLGCERRVKREVAVGEAQRATA